MLPSGHDRATAHLNSAAVLLKLDLHKMGPVRNSSLNEKKKKAKISKSDNY